jgi:hypothetical protein
MRFVFRYAIAELRNAAQPTLSESIKRAGHVTIF